jgi:hypothetical protein
VKLPLKTGLLGALLAWGIAMSEAHAQSLHVYLTPPPAGGDAATRRIFAELEQSGYVVAWATDGVSPCGAGARAEEARPPGAWISVELDAASHQAVARVCFWRAGASPELASTAAPAADHRQLALATVEALNGLLATPLPSAPAPAPPVAAPVPPPVPVPVPLPEPAPAAWLVHTSLAFDVFGGPPVIGAGVVFDVSLDSALSLELDSFVPLRASEVSGEQRELSLNVAWLRVGPRFSWQWAPVRLGVSLDAGAALLWAKARTTPPLVGTVDLAPAAIVSSGAWLEYPDESPLFFRIGGHVSRLLPSIELELGTGTALPFGEFLVDCGIGFGVRWDRAR